MAIVLRNSGQRSLPTPRGGGDQGFERSRRRLELRASWPPVMWRRMSARAACGGCARMSRRRSAAKEGWPSTSILGKPRWRSSTTQKGLFCEGQPSDFHFGCHWDARALCASGCFLSTPRSEVRHEPRHRQGGPSETWSCQTSLRANEEIHFSEPCPASIWTNCAFSKPYSFPIAFWERDMVRACQNYRQLHTGSSTQWLLTATGGFEILGIGRTGLSI